MNRPERIDQTDIENLMLAMGAKAREAARELALAPTDAKNLALGEATKALRARTAELLAANAQDLDAAKARGTSGSFLDRLALDEKRIAAIAQGLDEIAALEDPVGAVLAEWRRPNGLLIERVRTPLGVIGIIYERRPNVTADAGGLCLKAGNAAILRGGSESFHSSRAIHACLVEGLRAAGLPETAVQLVPTTDRDAVGHMLTGLGGNVDVIVPRGGKSLVGRVDCLRDNFAFHDGGRIHRRGVFVVRNRPRPDIAGLATIDTPRIKDFAHARRSVALLFKILRQGQNVGMHIAHLGL